MNQESKDREDAKPAWYDHNGQSCAAILLAGSALITKLLSSDYKFFEELDDINLLMVFCGIFFLVFILVLCLIGFRFRISEEPKPYCNHKKTITFLTLFINTGVEGAEAAVLYMVDDSYLVFVLFPVIGFVLVAILLFFGLNTGQNQDAQCDDSMVKRCFKVATVAMSTSYFVQIIACTMRNSNFQKHQLDQYILIILFLTACFGWNAMILTSSPLKFKSERMGYLLELITNVMLVLLGLNVVLISAEYLDAKKVLFAVIIPFGVLSMVEICQKSLATEGDFTSTGTEANSTRTGTEANSTRTGTEANETSTGTEANSTSTGTEANSTRTGTEANSTSTRTEANETSTGTEANSTSTGTEANSTSTRTEARETKTKGHEEFESTLLGLAGFSAIVLAVVLSVEHFREGHTTYLTYSVFFILMSTISSLMNMVFLSPRSKSTVITYGIKVFLVLGTVLAGLALLAIEFRTFINKVINAHASIHYGSFIRAQMIT